MPLVPVSPVRLKVAVEVNIDPKSPRMEFCTEDVGISGSFLGQLGFVHRREALRTHKHTSQVRIVLVTLLGRLFAIKKA